MPSHNCLTPAYWPRFYLLPSNSGLLKKTLNPFCPAEPTYSYCKSDKTNRNESHCNERVTGLLLFFCLFRVLNAVCLYSDTLLSVALNHLTDPLHVLWGRGDTATNLSHNSQTFTSSTLSSHTKWQFHLLNTYTQWKFQNPPGAEIIFHIKQENITIQMLYACSVWHTVVLD